MTEMEGVRSLSKAMEAEIACFELYIASQRSFSAAVRDRDWGALQTATAMLEEISAGLGECERVRAAAFEFLKKSLGCEDEGLYRVALLVSEPERTELTEQFRRLKLCAMRAKFEGVAAGEHAAGHRNFLRGVLEELFPEKKARIYGRSGLALQPGMNALVLDTAL
jgi:hypothetical protein